MDAVRGEPEPQGCADLLARVQSMRPRIHAYGHIHEGRGIVKGPTTFVNCAIWDERMEGLRPPMVLDIG